MRFAKSITVTRPSEDEPRDLDITIEFNPNEYLEDESLKLVKSFKHQAADKDDKDSIAKLTTSPVSIKWKAGRDITDKEDRGGSFFDWFGWDGEIRDNFAGFENIAYVFADDLYPNAVRLFLDSTEENEEDDSASEDLDGMRFHA